MFVRWSDTIRCEKKQKDMQCCWNSCKLEQKEKNNCCIMTCNNLQQKKRKKKNSVCFFSSCPSLLSHCSSLCALQQRTPHGKPHFMIASESQRGGMSEVESVCSWACVNICRCVHTLSGQDVGADISKINTSISLCLTLYTQSDFHLPLPLMCTE